MSIQQPDSADHREGAAEPVAGLLAAAALALAAVAIVYHPITAGAPAIVLALVAAGMARGRSERIAFMAVLGATVCWVAGMIVAVLTQNPLW